MCMSGRNPFTISIPNLVHPRDGGRVGQNIVLQCVLSLGTPKALVHLHQQPKTAFLSGRFGGFVALGMLWEIPSPSELTTEFQQVTDLLSISQELVDH